MKIHHLPQLDQPVFVENVKVLGKIVCMHVTDEKIAFAGSLGNILLFDRETYRQELFTIGGKITLIDIYEQMMVIGFEDGQICFIDLEKAENLKMTSEVHSKKLICLKIVYQNPEKDRLYFVSSDLEGSFKLTAFKKTFFSYKTETTPILLNQDFPIQAVSVLDEEVMVKYTGNYFSRSKLFAVVSVQKLIVFRFNFDTKDFE